ncbi:uncharacterized protein C8Q71DRAFT_717956 [Rhodofomes roseus]|uniref:Uncharacterized protein n=1 Tax=Rhodofomes roseus TaxID=34475 RepID=A0ABQ8JZD9_9APHY|nr:uncharacterized protein C8Q71DRAFT_717956 [Rhodofomes roseus]KAH9829672.1 hypothetical protein C8Q71DRAFT_717956 [Rhodofomes roseus]
MASILFSLQRGCRPGLAHAFARRACMRREIHQTPIAFKKQKAHIPEQGDLFGGSQEGESSEDLFSPSKDVAEEVVAIPSAPLEAVTPSRTMDPEERRKRFNDLLKFVALRIGRQPKEILPPVRNTAWQHLFALATTKEQMAAVVQLFPKWRDSKPRRTFTVNNAEQFVYRCEQLKCPDLALQVFADHPKYGFDLASPRAARKLLHALHEEYPLQATITLAALFGVYKLPPISSDLVTCAMFTAACLKHRTSQSLTVAREMVPQLKELLTNTDPKEMEVPKDAREYMKGETNEKRWVARSLAAVEQALGKEKALGKKGDYSWLSQWRQESGHAEAVSP